MQPEPSGTTASTAPWDDFPPLTPETWRERIRADLKGADLDKLVWHTLDGLAIDPFYTASGDTRGLAIRKNKPGNDWLIRQDMAVATIGKTRHQILEAIKGGANSLGLHIDNNLSKDDFKRLLADLPLGEIAFHLSSKDASLTLLDTLSQAVEDLRVDLSQLRASIVCDPLSHFVKHGEPDVTLAMNELAAIHHKLDTANANHLAISVDARPYHESGASIAQELGCTLAAASEYFVQMQERTLPVADIVARMRFEVPVGTSFFPEIAKLRALRLLFAQLVQAFDATLAPPTAFIRADTSRWSLTLYDPHANLLRTTTEAMTAILGGCDELSIQPYDAATGQPGDHARRLALNIQHILKYEAHLDIVVDPAAGSYFLEHLTVELAEAGWSFFQEIEARGGLISALQDGFVQKEIKHSRDQRFAPIDAGQTVFVGTNAFPQVGETKLDDAPSKPAGQMASRIEPLPTVQGAAHFEVLRLRTERYAKKMRHPPRVLPLMLGDPVMANARATFARNFFGVAGFQILPEQRHETPEQAASAAIDAKVDIVVLCSDDAMYTAIAAPICNLLVASEHTPLIVVAGYPEDAVDYLKQAGVDVFIHRKTHLLNALTDFQNRLHLSK